MFRACALTAALMLGICLGATPARAASLPARAEVSFGSSVDVAAFRQLVSNRYHVEFRVVVATDIDRDGDIDVLAATDRSVTVWVNDGAGHLRSSRPSRHPAIAAGEPASTWRGREDSSDPTVPGSGPAAPVLTAEAHAPPVTDKCTGRIPRGAPAPAFRARPSSPRAPPA